MNLSWIAEHVPLKAPPRLPVATTPRRAPAPNGMHTDDWSFLLRAVEDRLQRSVAEPAADTRIHVLDCLAALDQLQGALRQEVGRRERVEHELFAAQAALVRTRAQLHGTQAGVNAWRAIWRRTTR